MMSVTKIDIAALKAGSMLVKSETAPWGSSNVGAMMCRKARYKSMGQTHSTSIFFDFYANIAAASYMPAEVGRTIISLMSTPSGCSSAKRMARAIASGVPLMLGRGGFERHPGLCAFATKYRTAGCPARIRTLIDGVRVRSLTIRGRGTSHVPGGLRAAAASALPSFAGARGQAPSYAGCLLVSRPCDSLRPKCRVRGGLCAR
jgi:hypothetical protein